ncbi:MAG: F0F1 ATP synthase subunit epsilon [Nitrospirota bacterium]|jgi:F-type H+-transporting ATPase subunit epsilon
MKREKMTLKVLLPGEKLVEAEVAKVVAETGGGSFCLLPRHVDFAASLPPGILYFEPGEGEGEYMALDEGVLVKAGGEVLVAARDAVRGVPLGELRDTVEKRYRVLDERQRSARSAVARLEAGFVRRFIELKEGGAL